MNLITSYKSFVSANITWVDALAKALGKKEHLPDSTIEQLAEAHADAYSKKFGRDVFYQQSTTGSWYFYSDEACTREDRDDTTTRQWQRNVAQYHNVKKQKGNGKKVSTQVDIIDVSRRKAEKFAESHKAVEIRAEIEAVKAYLKSLQAYV